MKYTAYFIDSLVDLDNFIYYLEEGFNPDLLEREEAKAIWHFVRTYYERANRQSIPSIEVLEDEFPGWGFKSTDKSAHWILDKLKERWEFRESQAVVTSIAEKKPDEIFPYMKQKLWEAEQVLETERNVVGLNDLKDSLDAYYARWESGALKGATTGWEMIDKEIGGIRKGQLAVVAGRLKHGKTWFGLKAFDEQRKAGIHPIFFTLELSQDEIMERLWAMWTGLSYNKIVNGLLEPAEATHLGEVVDSVIDNSPPFWVIQPPQGQRKVSDFVTLADKYKAGSMIIDQLNWIEAVKADRDYFRDDLRIGDIAKELKLAAQRPGREMPVYVMHQFNRKQKGDSDLDDANFADSDKIGQIADHLFGVAKTKELEDNHQRRFEVVASRSAPSNGVFTVDFEHKAKTNMNGIVRGDTVGDMSVDETAILIAKATEKAPSGSLTTA